MFAPHNANTKLRLRAEEGHGHTNYYITTFNSDTVSPYDSIDLQQQVSSSVYYLLVTVEIICKQSSHYNNYMLCSVQFYIYILLLVLKVKVLLLVEFLPKHVYPISVMHGWIKSAATHYIEATHTLQVLYQLPKCYINFQRQLIYICSTSLILLYSLDNMVAGRFRYLSPDSRI